MHARLLELADEGKPYLAVLYNLGLTAFLATAVGLLTGKITDLISHNKQISDTTDNNRRVDSEK
jgi:hypothetical protein